MNEATAEELQQLPGIGPLRARRLVEYREQVSAIRNSFDIAAATGMGLRQANGLNNKVKWMSRSGFSQVGPVPFVVTLLVSVWLLTTALLETTHLDSGAVSAVHDAFVAGLGLLLAGLLVVVADLTLRSLREETDLSSTPVKVSLGLAMIGAALMVGSSIQQQLSELANPAMLRVNAFVGAALVIALLMSGPALVLRLLTSREQVAILTRIQAGFDLGLPVFLIPAFYALVVIESGSAIEEIFVAWTAVLLLTGAWDLVHLRSPFVHALSDLDQGRFRFMRRDVGHSRWVIRLSRPVGVMAATGALTLLIILLHQIS